MTHHWYALSSQPRKEEVLWREIEARDIEVYYPQIKVKPVNPRSKKVRPYFPGYLFVHIDLDHLGLSLFQWMPFAQGLVSFGGEPAAVPENLIISLQQKLTQINAAGGEVLAQLQTGDQVKIEHGPFAGYQAIFDTRLPGNERVRVLLKLLNQRQVPVELQVSQIALVRK